MEKNIPSLYENENLKMGDRQKRKCMSLCENEKKWGTDKNEKKQGGYLTPGAKQLRRNQFST
jgi:hypothetical protein